MTGGLRSTEIFAYTGKPLKDFIYESNKRKTAFSVETEEEAVNRLTNKYLQKRNVCYNENNTMGKGMRRMVISLRGVPYSAQAFAPRKV